MLDFTQQDWFSAPNSKRIMEVLNQAPHEARFIGGCVRNALVGKGVLDIDIATTEHPDKVLTRLEQAGIRVIPTGLAHGTVTAVIEGQHFEITTLRADIKTDGRHAEVAFSTDWAEDGARRDFTINAMSVDQKGKLHDPFNGLEDLKNGRVRFIGSAEERIREDYLRLLRFFRFSAYFGKLRPDEEAVNAALRLNEGITQLSGERIRDELFKILLAPRCHKWISLMDRLGIMQHILADSIDTSALEMLGALEEKPDALRRLACLLPNDENKLMRDLERLRLSNDEKAHLRALRLMDRPLSGQATMDELTAFLYRFGPRVAHDQLLLYWVEKRFSGIGPNEQALLQQIADWESDPKIFPLKGQDLLDRGFSAGKELGGKLKEIEDWWCDNGCRPSKEECLAQLT